MGAAVMALDAERHGWLAGLLVLLALSLGAEITEARRADPPPADATWPTPPGAGAEEEDATLEALHAIGYVSGTRHATDRPVGVVTHDAARAWPGLNLVNAGRTSEAFLLTMDGEEVHRWAFATAEAFPDWKGARTETAQFWRRVLLLPDGGLVAIHEGAGLIRLGRDSALVWARPDRAHHDLFLSDADTLVVLTRDTRDGEDVGADGPILEDFVSWVRLEDGETLRQVSLVDALANSTFDGLWRERARAGGDILHTNAVERLDTRGVHAAFAPGNLLLSMRNLSALAVLDPHAERIVWTATGDWHKQHDPHLLPDGQLLLFDNGVASKRSRVVKLAVEADGRTRETWSWSGPSDDDPLWTRCCGTVVRLPNDNLLVTETAGARAVELAPDGTVVWAYHSPHRTLSDASVVANLFEVQRIDPARVPAELRHGP